MVRQLKHTLHAKLEEPGSRSRVILQKFSWLGLVAITLVSGCVYSNHTDAGAGLGSGLGALTGAMIGQGSGHTLGGALIGAVAGGVVGGAVGNAADAREQRDAAVTHAQYLASTGQAMGNADVIRMVQKGLSDDLIINTIKSSVGQYDLCPDAIIQLKSYGVSDRVILALQKVPKVPPVSTVSHVTAVPTANVGVVVAPAPVMVYGGPRYHYYGGPYRGRW